MMEKLDVLYLAVITIGSMLGTVKASTYFDKDDKLCTQIINGMIGMFCGVMVGYHFGSNLNIWITGLIALAGSASATMALEVFLEMLPNTLGKALKKYTKNFTE